MVDNILIKQEHLDDIEAQLDINKQPRGRNMANDLHNSYVLT